MDIQALITAFFTLFVIIDPIGLTPLFVALTQGADAAHRRAIAIRATAIGFGILLLFAFFGEAVLGFAGISMPAFRIAGGLLLFLTALEMLFELYSLTRKNGRAFINVPLNSPAPDHIYLFREPDEVYGMIEQAGYQIEETRCFPATGFTLEKARRLNTTISCAVIAHRTS